MDDPTQSSQPAQHPDELDPMLLDLFARTPVAGDDASFVAAAAGAPAAAEAFTLATMKRIRAEHRRHAWLRVGTACAALAVAGSAITAGLAFTPVTSVLPDVAGAFGRALAMPSTWGATVVMLLALRSVAHALPGYGR